MSELESSGSHELEQYIFQKMTETGIPGLSIAEIDEGELCYERGFGFRALNQGKSATPRTIYCIGSVTKSFTALAIMQLFEKGLIKLEDPIEEFVSLKAKILGEPIQIRHLLNHSSGIPSLGYAAATLGAINNISNHWFPISNPQDLQLFMSGAENWALSKPGQRHAYMNAGYILLGTIIEKTSGKDYADYIKENILSTLRMNRSTFLEEEVKNDSDVATPYLITNNSKRVPTIYPYGHLISDGGLMSNVKDMVHYMKMFLWKGVFEDHRIVSSQSIETMIKPKIQTVETPIEGESYRHYGYGLRIKTNFLGNNLIHHSGSVYGSSAYMGFIPEKKVGVVLLANGGYFLEDIGEYALAILLKRDPMELTYFKRLEALNSLTGLYRTYHDTFQYTVTRNSGTLQLEASYGKRSFTTPLIPVDLDGESKTFRVYGVDSITPVEFIRRESEMFLIYDRTKAKRVAGTERLA